MKKIVVIGPESTGKSTLSAQLAAHYKTVWCPEFARDYLLKNGKEYTYDDLLHIAQGQAEGEEKLLTNAKNDLYFIDTDMYVMKVWCEVAFGKCHTWILKQIVKQSYDLYLLCDIDLPWKRDELREYPDINMRRKLFKMYHDIVINSGVKWVIISGTDKQRFQMAVGAIDTIFEKEKN